MRRIALLGSTGSIGTQALEVIRHLNSGSPNYEIVSLSAHKNLALLGEQVREFSPSWVSIGEAEELENFPQIAEMSHINLVAGPDGIIECLIQSRPNLVLNGIVGAAGLEPTLKALELNADVALANKESLVIGGHLVTKTLESSSGRLLPVDSEHNAIFQLLEGSNIEDVARIVLTASGGALRDLPLDELDRVTPEQVLAHPNWEMGHRITVDSATLVNKAFEVIEAHWLFGFSWEQIDVLIHPQSWVHGLVEFKDGSILAHLGPPDMREPIQYALTYPERFENPFERLDLAKLQLTFRPMEAARYPAFGIVMEAARLGGTAPAVVNAADEVAVSRFLAGEIEFSNIAQILQSALERHDVIADPTLEEILTADRWARGVAQGL